MIQGTTRYLLWHDSSNTKRHCKLHQTASMIIQILLILKQICKKNASGLNRFSAVNMAFKPIKF